MVRKSVNQMDDDPPELVSVGIFETKLSLEVVRELNRRKIIHRLDELDNHLTELSALASSAAEAKEVLEEIKRKNKRVRL